MKNNERKYEIRKKGLIIFPHFGNAIQIICYKHEFKEINAILKQHKMKLVNTNLN